MSSSQQILNSWVVNAQHWIATIDNAELESRKLVTNAAITDAIKTVNCNTVLDIGCGEGWLTRSLRAAGKAAYGTDAVEALVKNAIEKDGPYYEVATYQELAAGKKLQLSIFDAAVINFALIDKSDTEALLQCIPAYLVRGGYLFIQTLHPLAIAATDTYETGWKEGSWNGMKRNFEQPYQWYFRTLEDWMRLLQENYEWVTIKEPVHPETKKPLSVIFILKAKYKNSGRGL